MGSGAPAPAGPRPDIERVPCACVLLRMQGSALKAATMVAKHVGGKILCFSSGPPTMGEAVVKREPSRDKGAAATDRETDLLKPASDAYQVRRIAAMCMHVSVVEQKHEYFCRKFSLCWGSIFIFACAISFHCPSVLRFWIFGFVSAVLAAFDAEHGAAVDAEPVVRGYVSLPSRSPHVLSR